MATSLYPWLFLSPKPPLEIRERGSPDYFECLHANADLSKEGLVHRNFEKMWRKRSVAPSSDSTKVPFGELVICKLPGRQRTLRVHPFVHKPVDMLAHLCNEVEASKGRWAPLAKNHEQIVLGENVSLGVETSPSPQDILIEWSKYTEIQRNQNAQGGGGFTQRFWAQLTPWVTFSPNAHQCPIATFPRQGQTQSSMQRFSLGLILLYSKKMASWRN